MNRLLLLTLTLCLPLITFAQEIQIRTIGFAPYGIVTGQSHGGIYYETANILAREAGFQPNNHIEPYPRIIDDLKSGRADMTIMFKYDELENHVVYIAPLAPLKTVVLGLKGTSFTSISQLKYKKIAYLRGAHFSSSIDNDSDIHKYRTTDFLQGVQMLLAGRVDAIIGPIDPILSAAAQLNIEQQIFGEPLVVSERTPWVQLSKKSAYINSVKYLRAAFMAIKQRGAIDELRNKYIYRDKSLSNKE